MALLGIATRLGDSAARSALARATQDGSFDALGAIPDIASFPGHALAGFIATVVEGMARRRALPPGLGIEGNYVGPRLLADLNCVRPDLAQWEPLLDFLADGNVPDDYKSGALQAMSQRTGNLPEDIQDRLRDLALSLVEDQRDPDETVVREATVLAVTLGAYDDEIASRGMVDLLHGDDVARVRALTAIENLGVPEEHVGILVALTGDPDPYVRGWAAALLAIHVDRGGAGALAVAALDTALEDPGVVVPETIAGARLDAKTSGVLERVRELQQHRSAAVRLAAARQVSSEPD
jgi:HEAT repeat protein